jgi:hypothetical protein
MQINIDSDIKGMIKHLDNLQKKQIPFATAKALTMTAKDAQEATKKAMIKKLDRPTPFTLRGVAIERATKQSQAARVFIKDIQDEYLRWQIEGGTRKARNKALLIPENIKLNKYGNMPRKKVSTLRAKPNVFSGEVGGVSGIYQRYKRKAPKLLVAYRREVTYGVKFPFYKVVAGSVRQRFAGNFRQAMKEAMATAK